MTKGKLLITLPVALALTLLLLHQLQWSANRLQAELTALPALLQMDHWDDEDIDPDDAQWQPVRARLEAAVQHMPQDPELLASLGDAYTLRLYDDDLTEEQTAEAVARGSEAYKQSLQQRPTWLRDWDDLALIKYNQKLYADNDFQLALRQLALLGQHRPNMMSLLKDLSTKAWGDLTPETREIVSAVVEIEPLPMEVEGSG